MIAEGSTLPAGTDKALINPISQPEKWVEAGMRGVNSTSGRQQANVVKALVEITCCTLQKQRDTEQMVIAKAIKVMISEKGKKPGFLYCKSGPCH